jgi:hypothetical protein
MNEQTRATATTVPAPVEQRPAPAAPQDAWDRLAALAFGDAASAGGCSVHAHDCTCLAEEHASVGVTWPRDAGDHAGDDDDDSSASEQAATLAAPILPDTGSPGYPDSEPGPAPLWTPEPAAEPDTADRVDGPD